MTKSARVISPFSEESNGNLTPPSQRNSPSWPAPSKGRKMGICFECERQTCICEKNSQDSISICSEDEVHSSTHNQETDLSFISGDGSGPDIARQRSHATQFLPPPPADVSDPYEPVEEVVTPARHCAGRQEVREGDRQINIGEYRRFEDGVVMPDLIVFSVSSAEDVTVGPQKSVELNTNLVLHPEPPSVLNLDIPRTAQFNFCPLGPDAKNTSLAARACQIVGGPIFVGHRLTKRLKILISNPGSFAPIFLPTGTLLGVMEIFYTRY